MNGACTSPDVPTVLIIFVRNSAVLRSIRNSIQQLQQATKPPGSMLMRVHDHQTQQHALAYSQQSLPNVVLMAAFSLQGLYYRHAATVREGFRLVFSQPVVVDCSQNYHRKTMHYNQPARSSQGLHRVC